MALHLEHGAVELDAVDMELRQVLQELFAQMGVQYDLPPEVQGTVSVNLHNASYQQALEVLLHPHFTYDIGPHNTIYVHRRGTTWRPGMKE